MAVMQNIKNTKKFLLRDSLGNKSMTNFIRSGYFEGKAPLNKIVRHKRNLTESGNLQEYQNKNENKHNHSLIAEDIKALTNFENILNGPKIRKTNKKLIFLKKYSTENKLELKNRVKSFKDYYVPKGIKVMNQPFNEYFHKEISKIGTNKFYLNNQKNIFKKKEQEEPIVIQSKQIESTIKDSEISFESSLSIQDDDAQINTQKNKDQNVRNLNLLDDSKVDDEENDEIKSIEPVQENPKINNHFKTLSYQKARRYTSQTNISVKGLVTKKRRNSYKKISDMTNDNKDYPIGITESIYPYTRYGDPLSYKPSCIKYVSAKTKQ